MNHHTAVLFNEALSASNFLMGLCPLEMFNGALSTETVSRGFIY